MLPTLSKCRSASVYGLLRTLLLMLIHRSDLDGPACTDVFGIAARMFDRMNEWYGLHTLS